MRALSLASVKAHLSEVVTSAEHKHERVLIEKRNKPVAVVIGYEDYKKLEALEDIYESRLLEKALEKGKIHSLEEVAKKVNVGL
ncbi:MAG: type II toxin-antitoxin system Phd/YefM family antitoxin [Nitrospirae bacterium]|nr:type II toxin-antitoxin system Phd/YefM family antitoxin [Nitrospirota bacterium]